MKVLYEFSGSKHGEISLVVDQVISCDLIFVSCDPLKIVVLKEDLSDGWIRGMAGNSSPSSYVEELL